VYPPIPIGISLAKLVEWAGKVIGIELFILPSPLRKICVKEFYRFGTKQNWCRISAQRLFSLVRRIMLMRHHLAAACIVTATLSVNAANTIRVPQDQPTIQAGINAAAAGDTVIVAPGTYLENLNFSGKATTVISAQGPAATIIDGSSHGPVVTFSSGEGPTAVLSGFTMQHGSASFGPYDGGGISIRNSSPTISGNWIMNNVAADGGGGISSSFGSPVIRGNTISNNAQTAGYSGGTGGGGVNITGSSSAQIIGNTIANNSWNTADGGGVSLFAAGNPVIENNIIRGNSAYGKGGGIALQNQSDASIIQNIVDNNKAGAAGGGIYWLVPSGARGPLLVNNAIVNNTSPQGAAIMADGFDGQTQIINNIVVVAAGQAIYCGNFGSAIPLIVYNDVVAADVVSRFAGSCTDLTGINGNISADPLFVSPSTSDYHLQTRSPAIDAGTSTDAPAADLDGSPRPLDGNGDGIAAFDMGVYEAPALVLTPKAVLSTSALSFSMLLVGQSSTQTVVLSNVGNGSLAISGISITNGFSQSNNCGNTLAASQSCIINVTFAPSSFGSYSGALSIDDNAAGGPQGVALSGAAQAVYEAESTQNTVTPPTKVVSCVNCSGGAAVTGLGGKGSLTFNQLMATSSGSYTLSLWYVNAGKPGTFFVSANGGAGASVAFSSTGSSGFVTVSLTVRLQKGTNTIKFWNASAQSLEIDRITLR